MRRRALIAGGAAAAGVTAVGMAATLGSCGQPLQQEAPGGPTGVSLNGSGMTAEESPAPSPTPYFDRSAHSRDDPTSMWVIVNKTRPLNPIDYRPVDLTYPDVPYANRQPMRQGAADALVPLVAAARSEAGLSLAVQSAFRSYETQVRVYQGWVSSRGRVGADATSARPGHSEHQTGWAIDVVGASRKCALEICWGETPEGQWVGANAHRFGFVVRYRADTTPITGYESEPYHLRYVGQELAQHLHDRGITTLERFFGLPDAPDYPPGTTV
ncbi:hypothetical protein APU90_04075 [Rathayibacter toxicus]|nr:hypothetical protein APU90_04075 [Rathayibacter toxicus]KKM46129.1 hypothetical protein VT73_03415 [Rathayibacter toxicus]